MNVNVMLNKGFNWFHQESVWVKGYLFDEAGRLYENSTLAEYFLQIKDEKVFRSKVLAANGSFAVIINRPELKVAAVDRLRSIPLFYTAEDNEVYVSDNANWLLEQTGDKTFDDVSRGEFLRAGYVVGKNTLLLSIKQVQAGEYLIYKSDKLRSQFYYKHVHSHDLTLNEAEHFERLEAISERVFKRLIDSAEGSTLVIPLSGGYDSRYIAVMLKRLGYERVICYTYGREDSFEVAISKKVAEALGFAWHFVEYTSEAWEEYIASEQSKAYHEFAHNLSSLPHLQDFIALEKLTEQTILPPDAIFVPGFCGDLLGGSYVPPEILMSDKGTSLLKEGIVEYIYRRHFILENHLPERTIEGIKTHIEETLADTLLVDTSAALSIDEFISVNEAWFTEHRVAKFIVNALRPYEFFGHAWRMPLWDNELAEYWYRVPTHLRSKGGLYDTYLLSEVFSSYDVAFAKQKPASSHGVKTALRKRLPKSFFAGLRSFYLRSIRKDSKRDVNAISYLADYLYRDLKALGKPLKVTNALAQPFAVWLLHFLELSLFESDS